MVNFQVGDEVEFLEGKYYHNCPKGGTGIVLKVLENRVVVASRQSLEGMDYGWNFNKMNAHEFLKVLTPSTLENE